MSVFLYMFVLCSVVREEGKDKGKAAMEDDREVQKASGDFDICVHTGWDEDAYENCPVTKDGVCGCVRAC